MNAAPEPRGSYEEYLAGARTQATRDRLRMTETDHHDHERTVMDVHRLEMSRQRPVGGLDVEFQRLGQALSNITRTAEEAGEALAYTVLLLWEEPNC